MEVGDLDELTDSESAADQEVVEEIMNSDGISIDDDEDDYNQDDYENGTNISANVPHLSRHLRCISHTLNLLATPDCIKAVADNESGGFTRPCCRSVDLFGKV